MRLFCFSFAGGTAFFFKPLSNCLKPTIHVKKLEYAGHGTRNKEPFYQSLEELARDQYGTIQQSVQDGEPYALFGYSMGSIAVVEVLKKILTDCEIKPPCHVFLAAHEPFTKKEYAKFSQDDMDEQIKIHTIHFGGIPEKLIYNQSFWRMYLPIYRADYTMLGNYEFEKLQLKCQIPATVFFSETDTASSDMEHWRDYFVGRCEFVTYEGNHFFIYQHCQEIADIIKERLLQYEI